MNKKLYLAIKRSLGGSFLSYITQFLCLVIYSRLFSPEDFGLLATVQVFLVFFQMISNMGIGPALINESTYSRRKIDGIFTFTIILALFLSLILYYFINLLGVFYSVDYGYIDIIVSVSIFFSTLSIVPITALNKDTKFYKLSISTIVGEVSAVVFVLFFYFNSIQNELVLASRFAILSLIRFAFVYYYSLDTSIGRPRIGNQIGEIRSILSFSLYQFGFNFVNYFSRNLDTILIGKYIGLVELGIYQRSYELMKYPIQMTTMAMNPAIQPILSSLRYDKKDVISHEHGLLARNILAMSFPISIYIFSNSESIVLFLFGRDWMQVAPLLSIFSISLPVQLVMSSAGAFYQSINAPRLLFFSGLLSASTNTVFIILSIYLGGTILMASLLVVSFSVNFFQSHFILYRYGFGKCFVRFLISLLNGLFFGLVSACIFYLINNNIVVPYIEEGLVRLVVSGFLCLIVFVPSFYFSINNFRNAKHEENN